MRALRRAVVAVALGCGLLATAPASATVGAEPTGGRPSWDEIRALVDDHATGVASAPATPSGAKEICRRRETTDPAGDGGAVDVVAAAVFHECDVREWAMAFATEDEWDVDDLDSMAVFLETDNDPDTGCLGEDHAAFFVNGVGGVVFQTPSCDEGGWIATGAADAYTVSRLDAGLVWGAAAIGDPQGSVRAYVGVLSVGDTEADYAPDEGYLALGAAPTTPPDGPTPPPEPPAPPPEPPAPPPPETPGSFWNGRCDIPLGERTTNNSVARLYRAYFLRDADAGGLHYWVPLYRSGRLCLAEIADLFCTSPEFVATYGALPNPAFVRLVYVNVLGREPDPAGYDHWAHLITYGGLSRGAMMIGFSESAEFRARTGLP